MDTSVMNNMQESSFSIEGCHELHACGDVLGGIHIWLYSNFKIQKYKIDYADGTVT